MKKALNKRINWSKIPYISYNWRIDSNLSKEEKAEIEKAYDELNDEPPYTLRKAYLSKRICEKQNFSFSF